MDGIKDFADDYYSRLADALRSFDRSPLQGVAEVLERAALEGGTVWVAGNGGSAAIANHAVCDLTKGTYVEGQAPLRAVSLSANVSSLTAIGNDIAYGDIFRSQLGYYLRDEDAVLLVSSSGNSPNVVEACRYARERGIPTIAFVGFRGGKLAELAEHVVHVPVEDYGVVEDTHLSLFHVLSQFLRRRALDRSAGAAASPRG